MALGGYLFDGYKCTKPSGATNAEWAMLIHKTRIKSFIGAAENNDEWHFDNDKEEGDYSFEDYGNVIYDIDNSGGMNLVSFFRYKNENKYFAIVSMFNQTTQFNSDACGTGFYKNSSYNLFGSGRSCFEVASIEPFASVDFMLTGKTYPTSALSMMPISNPGNGSATPSLVTPSSTYTFFKAATCYFGHCVKGENIISFSSTDTYAPTGNSPYIWCVVHGFGAMSLSSPADTYNVFSITFDPSYNYENGYSSWSSNGVSSYNQTLKSDGTRYNKVDISCALSLSFRPSRALIANGYNIMPFESVSIMAYYSTTPISTDGICSKGMLINDLIAMNGGSSSSYFSKYTPYANGNYLLINHNTQNYMGEQCNYYVGWDPSNPEITSETAWTAYTGA